MKISLKSFLNIKVFAVIAAIVLGLLAIDNAQAAVIINPYNNYNGVRQINSGEQTKLNLSIYDTYGYYLTYSWNCNGGSLSDYNIANPIFTAPIISYTNTYTCTLVATNARGERGSYTVEILVNGNNYYNPTTSPNLSVSLTASPTEGIGSLNNVSLTANVTGSNLNGLSYMFDCKNDNSWESRFNTANTSYTSSNLCSYSTPGTYTAKVRVEAGNVSAENTTTIIVSEMPIAIVDPVVQPKPTTVVTTAKTSLENIVLETLARNLTKNEVVWENEINAEPGDQIEFNIIVTPTGKSSLQNVTVKNILSNYIDSVSDIKVGDEAYNGSIDSIRIDTVALGTSKVINFKAKVDSDRSFNYKNTEIVNTSEVTAGNTSSAKKDLVINVSSDNIAATAGVSNFTSNAIGVYLGISVIVFLAMLFLIFYLLIERKRMVVAEPITPAAGPEDNKINKSKYFVINS